MRGEEFVPGRYLNKGYTITSRGCPNRCYFCSVPAREGGNVRELSIKEGFNVQDDNLLACSEHHIKTVFAMLKHQKMGQPEFKGGLEAKRLLPWHVEALKEIRPKEIFFACDTPDDEEPLRYARELFIQHEYGSRNILRCYVLIDYPGDSISHAESRLMHIRDDLDMCPMAMLYRGESGETVTTEEWRKFQRMWARPAVIYAKHRRIFIHSTIL